MSEETLFGGSEPLSRTQLQKLCEFELPQKPLFSLGQFSPPGPIAADYMKSQGPIDAIMGPGGSGKTVASAMKGVLFSLSRMPIGLDGVIRAKGTVVRDNYRSLYRTTLQSWFNIFPPSAEYGVFSGGQDRPAKHDLKISVVRFHDGQNRVVPVRLTVEFFAIGDLNYELLFKSYETSWAWATEADGLDPNAIPFFFSRTGRFPSLHQLPPGTTRPRVALVDFNPPSPRHPLLVACKRGSFNEDFRPGVDERTINFFQQPSGLAPNAENRAGKTLAEYELEARTLPKDQVRRMVMGLPGKVKDGLPVYDDEFDETRHVSATFLEPLPHVPLHAGFDQGGLGGSAGSPAVVFGQIDPTNGQLRLLAENLPGYGVGAERFVDGIVPILTTQLRGLPPGIWTGDPSGFLGGDKVFGSLSWFEIMRQALGHRIDPAPTNEWAPRRDALGMLFGKTLKGGIPAVIIDPRLVNLIDGLSNEFKYGKRHDGTYDPLPVKNLHANVVEAGQYLVLGVFGLAGTISRIAQGSRPGNVVRMSAPIVKTADFDVF
jgi:hypothetical protein